MEKGIEIEAEEVIEILSQNLPGFSMSRKVKTNIGKSRRLRLMTSQKGYGI
jgi:hypothetical protein